jgi:uncharacterized protein (TIGR02147 family)
MIYQYTDYKTYILAELKQRHGRVHGSLSPLGRALGLSSTMISQIFRGPKHLTPEHGASLAKHLGLGQDETQYFLLLISKERAGSTTLKEEYERQLTKLRNKPLRMKDITSKALTLSDKDQKKYYSSWEYSAVRLTCELPKVKSAKDVVSLLGIPEDRVQQIIGFLLECGLLKRKTNGFTQGQAITHVGEDSVQLQSHHRNWRIRSMERFPNKTDQDVFISAAISLSEADAAKIRTMIFAMLKEIMAIAPESSPQTTRALVLDWMEF